MISLLIGVIGLVFGSFVNACVWRLRQQDELTEPNKKKKVTHKKQPSKQDLSILHGRSMCPNCHHTLAAKDLVPVLSWLQLRGKCRYCHVAISWQYPVVELLTALLFVVSYLLWPMGFTGIGIAQLVLWLAIIVCFMVLVVYDIRWTELPDEVVFTSIGLSVGIVLLEVVKTRLFETLWLPLVAMLLYAGLFFLLHARSKGAWLGFGDVKLALALGLLAASPLGVLLSLFLASLIGLIANLPLLIKTGKHGMKQQVPFGPALIFAAITVVLAGGHIITWYESLFI